jgi:hypothetical protein
MGDQPIARPLLHRIAQTQNKHIQASMPWVGIEPTIAAIERAKTCLRPRAHCDRMTARIPVFKKDIPKYKIRPLSEIFCIMSCSRAPWQSQISASFRGYIQPNQNVIYCPLLLQIPPPPKTPNTIFQQNLLVSFGEKTCGLRTDTTYAYIPTRKP